MEEDRAGGGGHKNWRRMWEVENERGVRWRTEEVEEDRRGERGEAGGGG